MKETNPCSHMRAHWRGQNIRLLQILVIQLRTLLFKGAVTKRRQLYRLITRSLLVVCLCYIGAAPSSTPNVELSLTQPEAGWLDYDPALLHTGDIIFRRGNSMASYFILSTDDQSPYSHVGIIEKRDKQVYVIHAVPGETEEMSDSQDYVQRQPIETFLSIDRASAAAIYRLRADTAQYAYQATATALTYAAEETRFDWDFDLKTPDQLYCTELVWRAYLHAGLDLVEGEFDQLPGLFSKGPYILPSTLLDSDYLQLVQRLQ